MHRVLGAHLPLALLIGPWLSPAPALAADSGRHLIYLHGRIVQEQQSARPVHPRFGAYELEEILTAFRRAGFEVEGGIRPKSASVDEAARGVAGRVRELLGAGVPAERITVVGASMGAAIAFAASAELANPGLRFVVLGACLSGTLRERAERGERPVAGSILAIRERSDETSEPCSAWSAAASGTLRVRELVIDTGLSHGFLYRPLKEWLEPAVAWARGDDAGAADGAAAALPDPLAAGWRGSPVCERLHEDEAQRVLRCSFPPGAGHERHFHPRHFGYALAGGRVRITDSRGTREVDLETGSSYASDGVDWHEVVNVGATTVAYLIVEPR
jgi:hypothetical protein